MSTTTAIERVAARLGTAGIRMSAADLAFLASALPALDAACASVRLGAAATLSAIAPEWQPRDAWMALRRDP